MNSNLALELTKQTEESVFVSAQWMHPGHTAEDAFLKVMPKVFSPHSLNKTINLAEGKDAKTPGTMRGKNSNFRFMTYVSFFEDKPFFSRYSMERRP